MGTALSARHTRRTIVNVALRLFAKAVTSRPPVLHAAARDGGAARSGSRRASAPGSMVMISCSHCGAPQTLLISRRRTAATTEGYDFLCLLCAGVEAQAVGHRPALPVETPGGE
jgi:hypothetical protein